MHGMAGAFGARLIDDLRYLFAYSLTRSLILRIPFDLSFLVASALWIESKGLLTPIMLALRPSIRIHHATSSAFLC